MQRAQRPGNDPHVSEGLLTASLRRYAASDPAAAVLHGDVRVIVGHPKIEMRTTFGWLTRSISSYSCRKRSKCFSPRHLGPDTDFEHCEATRGPLARQAYG